MANPYLEYGGAPTYGLPLFGWPRFGIPGAVHSERRGGFSWIKFEAEQYNRHLAMLRQQDNEFQDLLEVLIRIGVL